ncbi:MAG: OPT/YSL family transporter [Theionarchaea archaeon]|nr:OPT/YSL family transporter [Theionarchaea archaeon]MBU7037580.1 OPT/YSL family transporter [Theionarchaea archaeon]
MTEKTFTARSLLIGLVFGSLVAVVNAFLVLTVGLMITGAMISVAALFAYASLFQAPPPSSKEAVISYTVHQAAAFAFSIFPLAWVLISSYGVPESAGMRIPDWVLPNKTLYGNVLQEGVILSKSWITPLSWMVPVAIISGIAALMVVIWLRNSLITEEDLAFPEAQAGVQFIKGLHLEKYRLDSLFYGMIIGFVVDFVFVYYPSSLGIAPDWLKNISAHFRLLDLTPYVGSVLHGALFCVIISLGFIGLGMLMSARSTFNMFGSAVAFYVFLSALLVSRGTIKGYAFFSNQWTDFRYPYGLSIAAGLLITAGLAPLILKLISPLLSGSRVTWKPSKSTVIVFIVFSAAVLMLASVLSFDRFVSEFPLSVSKAMLVGCILLGLFLLAILIDTRIAGEAGIVWLSQFAGITDSIRQFALSSLGVLGFSGFAITESLQGSRFAAGQMEALKVGEAFDVNPKHQYLGALLGWCFGWLISTPFVFLIWHFYGVGGVALPMANMQSVATSIVAFSTGQMGLVFDGFFVLAGLLIGIVVFFLQKRNLPFVLTAVGIGALVGPLYTSTFFIGGLVRAIVERVKGTAWMDEKGKPFAAGLVLGGIALAPLVMVLINVVVSALGGG